MAIFTGSGVAIITPFTETGIDFIKLAELIEWHIAEGTDAIVVCGTTGEASTMTLNEKKETIKFTVDIVNKRIPVIAGTGSNDTLKSIEMSKYAESVGVDGLLVITPYYNKTNSQGLIRHFEAINNEVSTPIVLYNVPSRTGMNITPEQLLKLSSYKNIVAIKEASGNISQITMMKALCRDSIDIYSGNDDQVIPLMSLGALGVISVMGNIVPSIMHEMTSSYLAGDIENALNLQLDYMELYSMLFVETNPIPVKTALNLMGKNVGDLRLPLYNMEEINKNKLITTLTKYRLL